MKTELNGIFMRIHLYECKMEVPFMRILGLILGLWLSAMPAFAQDADAIENVISGQLEAFNDRDVDGAWDYAGPNIKRMFGNARNFGLMVERGYPMVWDNADVRFLELRQQRGGLWHRVQNGIGEIILVDVVLVD